jgi:hypothetical protein
MHGPQLHSLIQNWQTRQTEQIWQMRHTRQTEHEQMLQMLHEQIAGDNWVLTFW